MADLALADRIARQVRAHLTEADPQTPCPCESCSPAVADASEIAQLFDHTLLRPDATGKEIEILCDQARTHRFAAVCVHGLWVPLCKQALTGSGVSVCSVVGFPMGAMAPAAKQFEAKQAVQQGADEIDMVVNMGALKAGDYPGALADIEQVVAAARPALVKVILETGLLSTEEKIAGATLARLAGARLVKTSTGFGPGGATVADVSLLRRVVGQTMGVKASGGIRRAAEVLQLLQAGASRIGTSASVEILRELERQAPTVGAH